MKLILTENQLNIIKKLLTEEKVSTAFKKIKASDFFVIIKKNKDELKFRVYGTDGTYVYFKSIDTKSTISKNLYMMSSTSFNDGEINVSYIHSEKDKELKGEPSKWKKTSFKDIIKFLVYDENKKPKFEIDVLKNKLTNDEEEDDNDEIGNDENSDNPNLVNVEDVITDIHTYKKGELFFLELEDSSKLTFEVISVNSGVSSYFKLIDVSGSEGNRYEDFINDEFEFLRKKDSVSTYNDVDLYIFDLNLNKYIDDKTGKKKEIIKIHGIVDHQLTNLKVNSKNNKEEEDDENEYDFDSMSSKEIVNLIMKTPELKSAFIKQPSFLDLVIGGSQIGLGPARGILSKYYNIDDFSKNFKKGKQVGFELIGDTDLILNSKIRLKTNQKYRASTIESDGGKTRVRFRPKPNSKDYADFLINDVIDEEKGIYLTDIITVDDNGAEKKEVNKKIKFKFFK